MGIGWLTVAALGMATPAPELGNSGFEQTHVRAASDLDVAAMKKLGWQFRSPLVWPKGWAGSTGVSNVHFAVVQDRPHSGKNAILLWGQAGSSGYLSTQVKGLTKGIYKGSFWGRGKGSATLMCAGLHIVLNAKMSDQWAEYAGIFRNTITPAAKEVGLTLQAQKGVVFLDDVSLVKCSVLEAALVEESTRMRKGGTWLAPGAKVAQDVFRANLQRVRRVLPRLKTYAEADPIPERMELLGLLARRVEELGKVKGKPGVTQSNQAAAYWRIGKRLLVELEFEDVKE
jgi:hypothetical protein